MHIPRFILFERGDAAANRQLVLRADAITGFRMDTMRLETKELTKVILIFADGQAHPVRNESMATVMDKIRLAHDGRDVQVFDKAGPTAVLDERMSGISTKAAQPEPEDAE